MNHSERPRAAPWRVAFLGETAPGELPRLLALMGLFFLVACAVGILRPIKNALALDGLGATDFYRVYLVSAVVVLFVPAFNRLADRLPWRVLFGAVALFFAMNLLLFRLWYVDGSAMFGLLFYGWYDLFAAALVTQFFMATQFYFDARSARRAYPVIIAGGSIGATIGGGITGVFARSIGAPDLLLVAALFITIFAVCIPWVLHDAAAHRTRRRSADVLPSAFRDIFAHRQVRLIAVAVLLTVIVKQLVDYQFNAITKDVFETRDAISAFQGTFNAATQWLPLVVLVGLRPALRRWGIGIAVLLLPLMMVATTAMLALAFGLVAAVAAKGAETSLRYSAERAGREILYVPVPDEIKLKAKAYIDVAVEKGLGKVAAALLIMALLPFMDYRQLGWVAFGLALLWLALAISVRRQYVLTLAQSIQGRVASLRGVHASLVDASTLPVLRAALAHPSPLRAAFGLELVEQLPAQDVRAIAPDLNRLMHHEQEQIRVAALAQFVRAPEGLDTAGARERLLDEAPAVRTAAVHALLANAGDHAPALLHQLLTQNRSDVRTAALAAVLGNGAGSALNAAACSYIDTSRIALEDASVEDRAELALAAAAMPDGATHIGVLLDDDDAGVRALALRSASLLGATELSGRIVAALGDRRTRVPARDALVRLGPAAAVTPLAEALLDSRGQPGVRRVIPSVLARMPTGETVDIMLRLVLAPETDQVLDHRIILALSSVRARHPHVVFDRDLVLRVAWLSCDTAAKYADVRPAVRAVAGAADGRIATLLLQALDDAWLERREDVFRCIGMIHPSAATHSAHDALMRGNGHERANAREWVEEIVGHQQFRRLSAVLEPGPAAVVPLSPAVLTSDADPWIAALARALTTSTETDMELIEKVFLLQQVDLLQNARGAHVALLASIADTIDVPAGTVIMRAGTVPDAMYVVTRGAVELHGAGHSIVAGPEQAFGTWALIDEEPGPLDARARDKSRLLRVTREDFHDLLADHPELAIGLMRGLARRMRQLVA